MLNFKLIFQHFLRTRKCFSRSSLISLIELIYIAGFHILWSFTVLSIASVSFLHETCLQWSDFTWSSAIKPFYSLLSRLVFLFLLYTLLHLASLWFQVKSFEVLCMLASIFDGNHLTSFHHTLLLLLFLKLSKLSQGKLGLFAHLHILRVLTGINYRLLN